MADQEKNIFPEQGEGAEHAPNDRAKMMEKLAELQNLAEGYREAIAKRDATIADLRATIADLRQGALQVGKNYDHAQQVIANLTQRLQALEQKVAQNPLAAEQLPAANERGFALSQPEDDQANEPLLPSEPLFNSGEKTDEDAPAAPPTQVAVRTQPIRRPARGVGGALRGIRDFVSQQWENVRRRFQRPAAPEAPTTAETETDTETETSAPTRRAGLVAEVRRLAAEGRLHLPDLRKAIEANPDNRDRIISLVALTLVKATNPGAMLVSILGNVGAKVWLENNRVGRARNSDDEFAMQKLLEEKLRAHVARREYNNLRNVNNGTVSAETEAVEDGGRNTAYEAVNEMRQELTAPEAKKNLLRSGADFFAKWMGRGLRLGMDIIALPENVAYKIALGGQGKLRQIEQYMQDMETLYSEGGEELTINSLQNWLRQEFNTQPSGSELRLLVDLCANLADLQAQGDIVPDNFGARFGRIFGVQQEKATYRRREFLQMLRSALPEQLAIIIGRYDSQTHEVSYTGEEDKRLMAKLKAIVDGDGQFRPEYVRQRAEQMLRRTAVADVFGYVTRAFLVSTVSDALRGNHAGGAGAAIQQSHGEAGDSSGLGHAGGHDGELSPAPKPQFSALQEPRHEMAQSVGDNGQLDVPGHESLWNAIDINRPPVINAAKNLIQYELGHGGENVYLLVDEQKRLLAHLVSEFYPEGGGYQLLGNLSALPSTEYLAQLTAKIANGEIPSPVDQNIIAQIAYRASQGGSFINGNDQGVGTEAMRLLSQVIRNEKAVNALNNVFEQSAK